MTLRIEVIVRRGAIAESQHRVEAVVIGPEGARFTATDSADRVTTFRSAAKPFQLLPLVERGHARSLGCSAEELAVMASSHTGSARHVELVSGILSRLGLDASALRCGYHEPLDPESRLELASHPERQSPLYNNCSGKHAGLLALAHAEGWPVLGYEHADHPVQRLMHHTIAEVCGLAVDAVPVAIDGCSVSVFGVPLSRMARAYARLAVASGESARDQALASIREAMRAFPLAAGGAQRFSTALMIATRGRIVAKGGAEGLECLALGRERFGLAVKCVDGSDRAVPPAVVALLEHLDAIEPHEREALAPWRRPLLRNHAGLEVGALEAAVRAETPAAS